MNFEQLLRALLASVYKMPVGDIDAILSASDSTEASVEAAVLEKERERIASLTKPKPGQTFQDGYKKAKAEERKIYEQELKAHFNIESELTGPELLAEIVDHTAKAPTTSEEEVKKSPVYIARERELLKKISETNTTWEQRFAEREAAETKEKAFGTVSKTALDLLESMNPVLPDNPTVATNWKNKFVEEFKGYDYDLTGNDPLKAPVMKDGQTVLDELGHIVTVGDLVKKTAPNYFTFAANNGGQNGGNGKGGNQNQGGNGNNQQAKGYPEGIKKPTNFEEYSAILNDRTIKVEDRRAVSEAWEAEQQGGTK